MQSLHTLCPREHLTQHCPGQRSYWQHSAVNQRCPVKSSAWLSAVRDSSESRTENILTLRCPGQRIYWLSIVQDRKYIDSALFYILNALIFCVLLKNAIFFYILFSSFCDLWDPKERWVLSRSFLKNVKERRECNVLLQRM